MGAGGVVPNLNVDIIRLGLAAILLARRNSALDLEKLQISKLRQGD